MAMDKARLGRGLEAPLSEPIPESGDLALALPVGTAEVPLSAIEPNPHQPRKSFDQDELSSLTESIRNHGVLQPLVVRPVGDHFQLDRRRAPAGAAQTAGLAAVPVHVVDFNDQQVLEAALVENIQRTDLNPIEKAHGFKEYLDRFHMTHDQLASRLGLARSTITNLVTLLDMPLPVQDAVRVGELSTAHAKLLKGITDPVRQIALVKEITARGLSLRDTDALLKQPLAEGDAGSESDGSGKPAVKKTGHVQSVENELRQKLSVKVDIKLKAKDRGQIILAFESNDDFDRILEVLRR